MPSLHSLALTNAPEPPRCPRCATSLPTPPPKTAPWCSRLCRRLDSPQGLAPREPREPRAAYYYCSTCGGGVARPAQLTGRRITCEVCDPQHGLPVRERSLHSHHTCECGHRHERKGDTAPVRKAPTCAVCGRRGHNARTCGRR